MKIYFLITFLLVQAAKSQCPEGWQSDVNEWVANKAKFTPPSCYQFTVSTNTISAASRSTHLVSVKSGVALGDDMSLSDYMDEISSLCYMRCPVSGASCRIAYYAAGYPFQILIDENQSVVGEERNVEISNFAEVECDEIPPPVDAPVEPPTTDALEPVPSPVEQPIESSAPVSQPISEPVEEPVDSPVTQPSDENNQGGSVSDLNTDEVTVQSSALAL